MEMYDVSEFGNSETCMIQGVESNIHIPSPHPEQSEAMYYEGTPEFVADQGMYYPTATNYGYYCTGYESPSEWEDHHRVFGIDGSDIQYTGAQNEFLNYVYYTPNYGYAQSEYNPYNPYIPGAVMGVDGPFIGAQPYYPISYQNSVSSSAYIPIGVQPDLVPVTSPETFKNPPVLKYNERGFKTASSGMFPRYTSKQTLNQANSLSGVPEELIQYDGSCKQSTKHGSISAGNFQGPVSSQIFQGKGYSGSPQLIDSISSGKFFAPQSQVKACIPFNNAISEFGLNANGQGGVGKFRPKIGQATNEMNGCSTLGEQNRGPRVYKSRNELAVRAYSTKVLDGNEDGNNIIYSNQYNKNDFPVDYVDAKFFVIKSYSEDDIHKSIKYNIWSSTPHGNKKLNSAYEDALRSARGKPNGCPIFLFYSVNASGQFCGVAEITGPVDFNKDMDFWQQDKWSGSFPVKWHIIKDVSNTNFRHIILENNENKPVTNSRDTQEIPYKKGLEMLKIFKNHTLKTSLLDDFMYYENHQKIMQEEKDKFCIRSLEGPFFPSSTGPPRKLNSVANLQQTEFKKLNGLADDLSQMRIDLVPTSEQLPSSNENAEELVKETKRDLSLSTLNAISISSRQKELESNKPPVASTNIQNLDVVNVGSIPVKVNGFSEVSAVLTVGTIPLDPRALQLYKKDGNMKF